MKNPFTRLKNWWLVAIPREISQGLQLDKEEGPETSWWIEFHSKPTRFHIRHQGGRIVATAYRNDYEKEEEYEAALRLARQIIYEANARAKEILLLPTYINKKGKKL